MKVLVTGGAGFIGSHIVDELLANDIDTIVVDNLSSSNKQIIDRNIKFYSVDIQSDDLKRIFLQEKPDYVIHQAAQVDVAKSINHPFCDAHSNILGTINLLQCCVASKVKKIIYASSGAVYGETKDISISESEQVKPISFYGLSKYTPEAYIRLFHQLYGLPYVILRYANVYGPRQKQIGEGGVVSTFISKLLRNEIPVIYSDGEQTRDFIYVKDVARANVLSLFYGMNDTLNIGSNKKTSINKLYSLITSKVSFSPSPNYRPKRKGDIPFSRLDNSLATKTLKWSPLVELNEGLAETILFYKNYLEETRSNEKEL